MCPCALARPLFQQGRQPGLFVSASGSAVKAMSENQVILKNLALKHKASVTDQARPQHFQGLLCRQIFELFTPARIIFAFDDGSWRAGERHEYRPNRFGSRAAGRSGNARHRYSKICAKLFPCAFSHSRAPRLRSPRRAGRVFSRAHREISVWPHCCKPPLRQGKPPRRPARWSRGVRYSRPCMTPPAPAFVCARPANEPRPFAGLLRRFGFADFSVESSGHVAFLIVGRA